LRGEFVEFRAGAAELRALESRDLQLQRLDCRAQQDDFSPLRLSLRCMFVDEMLQFINIIGQ